MAGSDKKVGKKEVAMKVGVNSTMLVLMMFMAGGLAALSFLYFSASRSVSDRNLEIGSLKEERDLLIKNRNDSKVEASAAKSELEEVASTIQPEEDIVKYEAKIADFKLELDKKYRIIVELDSPFEGPGATLLSIGTPTDEFGVVNGFANANISGYFGTKEDRIAQLESNQAVKDSTTTFAGQSAQVLKQQVIGGGIVVVFENGEFVYEVAYPNGAEQVYKDIEAGFSFN